MNIADLRNIGISAHIDTGKTTLSERVLYYTGRIHQMQEVHGEGGATMDHMELEKERGITITSAATTVDWNGARINLIDTPGHVDFTVEVERSLRVLDGAILVLCAVGGVQAQSLTIDRQMRRYSIPRLAFINKMDRAGADPARVLQEIREKLGCEASLMQIPIGSEAEFSGVVDLVELEAVYFDGPNGEAVRREPIPAHLADKARSARYELLESLSLFDDDLLHLLLADEEVPTDLIHQVVREAVLARRFTPVLLGSAYRNKGVQPLLDAVVRYLPSPLDCDVKASTVDRESTEAEIRLAPDASKTTVAMAFKVMQDPYGALTFMRIYQGKIVTGSFYFNQRNGKKERISRLVRMHADQREAITTAEAGDIVAAIGIDGLSGDTYCSEYPYCSLERMFIPEPVITVAISTGRESTDRLSRALQRLRREDPTLKVSVDEETAETLISGMGELHLEIFVERIRREFGIDVKVGAPKVNYREAPTKPVTFNLRHKKQTGGSGQFAHIIGQLEVLPQDSEEKFVFEDEVVGGRIPRQFIPAVEKGFRRSLAKGPVAGFPVVGLKVVLTDGAHHVVDSSELAFQIAAQAAMREFFPQTQPALLEPIMQIEIECPNDFQGGVLGDLISRRGTVTSTDFSGPITRISGQVPLSETFGYSTDIRSLTQGQGTFTLEFSCYQPVTSDLQQKIIAERRGDLNKAKVAGSLG